MKKKHFKNIKHNKGVKVDYNKTSILKKIIGSLITVGIVFSITSLILLIGNLWTVAIFWTTIIVILLELNERNIIVKIKKEYLE